MLFFNLTTGSLSMASALCSPPLTSFRATPRPGKCMGNHNNQSQSQVQNDGFKRFPASKFRNLKAKAAKSNPSAKPNSVICGDCDGNGAVQCSQCKGSGVNSVDLFNGQFKAGDSCWLCGMESLVSAGTSNEFHKKKKTKKVSLLPTENGSYWRAEGKLNAEYNVSEFGIKGGMFQLLVDVVVNVGKNDMLCGNCNGAGFVGGFLSTHDE